jgi:hypothetical protein
MAINVNLLMELLNSNAILTNICHIKLDHATLLLKNATVHMVPDAISYIPMKMKKKIHNH